MEDELLNSFSKFRLVAREEDGIALGKEDVRSCEEECGCSILGKIWGTKQANFTGLKNTLSLLWNQEDRLKVVELGQNYFQFIFDKAEEIDRILQKRPWFFDNQMIVMQRWQPDLKQDDPSFTKGRIWIQIRGLPTHWSSKEVGWKLGKLFPNCFNVVIPEHGSKEGKIIRCLVG